MNMYGITYQAMIPGQTTSYRLAKEMGRSLKLLFDGPGL